MAGSIIQETVALDKKARQKIEELEKEKFDLESKVREDTKDIKEMNKKEVEQKLKQAKIDFEKEIKDRQEKEVSYFEKHLKSMEDQFNEHKSEWVEEIFKACIES